MQLSSMSLGLTLPRRFGGSSPISPLRLASPTNEFQAGVSAATTGTALKAAGRVAFTIGSTNLKELILSFNNWFLTATAGVTIPTDPYNVLKIAIEKDGQTFSVPVTFSGLRSKTISPGDVDIQSDSILPAAFGLTEFTRGDRYWYRFEYTVDSAGMKFPTGPYMAAPTGTATGTVLMETPYTKTDSYGVLNFFTWAGAYANVYQPIILGRAVSGDVLSIMAVGDSIVDGAGDTTRTAYSGIGSFSKALFAADFATAPIAGLNTGVPGATGITWNTTNSAKARAYFKYASHVYEEMGINSIGAALSVTQGYSETIWDYAIAAGCKIVRGKLTPWTTTDGYTLANVYMQLGGNAHLFNDWLDTRSDKIFVVIPRNSMRLSSDPASADYFRWLHGTADSTDGLHPISAGYAYDAADLRAVFTTLSV